MFFMLEANQIVDDELVLNVYGYGYSRIPVYEGEKFVYFLLKRLHKNFHIF